MKKLWLFSPFILSMLASPLFGEDVATDSSEIASTTMFGKYQRGGRFNRNKNAAPEMNYRLPADFSGWNSFAEVLVWQVQEEASHFVATPKDNSTTVVPTDAPGGRIVQLLGDIGKSSFD